MLIFLIGIGGCIFITAFTLFILRKLNSKLSLLIKKEPGHTSPGSFLIMRFRSVLVHSSFVFDR